MNHINCKLVLCLWILLQSITVWARDIPLQTMVCYNKISPRPMYVVIRPKMSNFACCHPPPGYEKVKDCEPYKPWTTQFQQIASTTDTSTMDIFDSSFNKKRYKGDNATNIICKNNVTTHTMYVVAGGVENFGCCCPPLGYKVVADCRRGEPTTTVIEQFPPDDEHVVDNNHNNDAVTVRVSEEVIETFPPRLKESDQDTSAILPIPTTLSETNISATTVAPPTKPVNYASINVAAVIIPILALIVILSCLAYFKNWNNFQEFIHGNVSTTRARSQERCGGTPLDINDAASEPNEEEAEPLQ